MPIRLGAITNHRLAAFISISAMVISLSACGETTSNNSSTGKSPGNKTNTTTSSGSSKLDLGGNVELTGAGASFPAPLYQAWFVELNKKYSNLKVNYQSVGSSAGVEQFTKGTVEFGASDVAMKDEEIKKIPADKGVLLLPVTAGTIVLAYNLPDVTNSPRGESILKLPRAVYTSILLGKIKSWDDPAIAKANPGAKLPKEEIKVIYRADGSGTTGVFTKHLSAVSSEWKTQVGNGKSVKWPVGIGAKGNEGVIAQIQQTPGSIGYVEYGYAKQNKLNFASLENKAQQFVAATPESAAKTLASVTLPENLRTFISDPEGADSYPIVTYTWILVHKKYADAGKAKAVEATIEYALTDGQKIAAELGYVPLPANVIAKVAAAVDQISPGYKISVGADTKTTK
jgi:phosphate transport system substrate-binding protein